MNPLGRLFVQLGLLIAPDAAMAVTFAIAWLAPHADPFMTADTGQVMALEGLLIVGCAMVGVYVNVARIFLPLILAGLLWYLIQGGVSHASWVVWSFGWYIVSAFVRAVLAHRGRYGNARLNPDHPARRYDRMLFLYVLSAPAVPAALLTAQPVWAAWGTAYFGSLALCDSVLRGWFDRLPQGLLRRWQASVRPSVVDRMGLCTDCVHVQPAIPQAAARLVRCQLSVEDPRFPEYPETPVTACAGFRSRLR